MNQACRAGAKQRPAALLFGLPLAIALASAFLPTPALAHEFGVGKDAYEDFLSGNQAVFVDFPVVLGVIAAGLFVSIWRADGFPTVWLPYLAGLVAGAVLAFALAIPPALPMFVTVIFVGLLGALAPDLSTRMMQGIYFVVGMVLTNAVLSGHTIDEIPAFSYVGIAFALNFGVSACAAIVYQSREKLSYDWVMIVWRAGSSWLVAIAVMGIALMLRSTGG
ncbi:MAG: hypothetical protein AAF035_09300 [Pseudomonadota bacterium]